MAKQDGKEYFLSPFDTKAQQQKNIELAISAEAHRQKEEEKKQEQVSIYRATSYNKLVASLQTSKENGRTPLLVSSVESKLTNQQVIGALQNDGSAGRNICQLYLKDLTLASAEIPFDKRERHLEQFEVGFVSDQVEQKRQLGEVLHNTITGQEHGQILVNFDQCEVETSDEALNPSVGTASKQWTHMYDADYKLLFNKYVFPPELLSGCKVDDYMIVKYKLFDNDMVTENIFLSGDG